MRNFIRTKLTLMLTVLIMLTAAAVPLGISIAHSWPTHAAPPAAVTIPSMKLPWDRSLTTIPLTGGPFGNYPDKTCTLENKSIMSGVDFGLPQNTDVLAVAAGRVIYAGYTNNQIRNEVRIDHGGGFVTEYWALNSIDPSIVTGVSVAQGRLLGKSGYTPCPKCKNGISVHLRLEFRHYTSDPLLNIPLSAHGMAIDGYKIWTFVKPSTGQGYNFQGTMTRGKTIIKFQSECGVNGVKTWYSLNGPTILAIANGTGGFLTSTNQVQIDWPMFGFNAQHTHFNPYENVLNPSNVFSLTLDWKAPIITTGSSPAVVNNVVYICSGEGYLEAFNASTGAILWIAANGGGGCTSSPAVVNGVAYIEAAVSNGNCYLYAYDATTGTELWATPLSQFSQSPPVVINGVVYIGTDDTKLYAYNATTGSLIWNYSTDSYISSSPAVINGIVYISSGEGTLYALSAATGSLIWSYATGDQIDHSSPSVVDGVVYIGSANHLYALNATTGTPIWTVAIGNETIPSIAVAYGVVYYGSTRLYAFNAASGAALWVAPYTGSFIAAISVANQVVYADSYDNSTLFAFNAATGGQLWSYNTGNSLFSSPAIANGVVYVASFNNLFAFHLPGATH